MSRKKICFFLGRIHHAAKLLPVAIHAENRGFTSEILIADNSINIDPTTEFLGKYGIAKYYHANDYLDGYERKEMGFPPPINVPPYWMFHSYNEARKDLHAFRAFLSQEKPDAVFALHENNFFVKLLFYCAKQFGVRTYSLQEGIILEREEEDLKKYSGGTRLTDVVFSWFDKDRSFYNESSSKIVPVGPPHMDTWLARRWHDNLEGTRSFWRPQLGLPLDRKVVLFAPPRLDLYEGDPFLALSKLVDWTRDRGIHLIIKLHPFQAGVEKVASAFGAPKFTHTHISKEEDAMKFLAVSDLVITQTSTVGVEAAALGLPVIEWDLEYIGLPSLSGTGLTTLIEGEDWKQVEKFLNEGLRDVGVFPGNAGEAIVEYMSKDLK